MITHLICHLEDYACLIFKWFVNNQMQGNATKCQVLLSTKEKFISKTDSTETENSESEKLLGVTIDSDLCFEKYVDIMVKQRLNLVCYLGYLFLRISTRSNANKRIFYSKIQLLPSNIDAT